MTLRDFAAKKATEIRRDGFAYAASTGLKEVASKASVPVSNYRATPIWAADWDVCLVLDACRWDLWCEVAPAYNLPLSSGWSVGSASVEWINNTFADRHHEDWGSAGYVTANPHTAKKPGFGPFTDESVYPLSSRGLRYLDEVWVDQWHVDEYETVRPEIVTERGMFAWKNRLQLGIDRLVVHYMQPHIPFRNHGGWSRGWKNTLAFGDTLMEQGEKDDWEKLRDGDIPLSEFWDAYADNLRWVLENVAEWLARTDAQILVTSDHGNAKGEWGLWGHPPGSPCSVLRKVPWAVVDGDATQQIDPQPRGDPPVIAGIEAEQNVEEQLAALGYT